MSKEILLQLLKNVTQLDEQTCLKIKEHVESASISEALTLLDEKTRNEEKSSKSLGALRLYLLHLNRQYTKANEILDEMIGISLTHQLSQQNCPTEEEIIHRWDNTSEGVSILCTTYNHARFIDMALASFFSQITTHPFEVIVRDDASTDGTGEILKSWQSRYPKILKVISLEKNTYQLGQSPMLATLPYATKPLLAMCEGDDFWIDNNKIHLQAELLEKNPTWSAITHNHFELDESTGKLLPGRTTKIRGLLAKKDLICINTVMWGHTLLVRRSLLQMPSYNLKDGVLGDQVMTAMLGAAGPVYFVGDLFGSVARRNLFSTYTPLNAEDKQRRRINTRRFLAPILSARGEKQAARRLLRWCDIAEQQRLSAD
jgi:hypothetical protein